eukprot:CAMPEP_0178574902 /NCGR_PEP_ID=MMETSP0697-20121206/19612_1 /TAXON_ID=265572 /ORGANISM="Extubocellulus spinifer, Strain CCMP396" /LENGTH=412 /DNA_ID=CAMNT_0020209945 /DNA_START=122 /DNA_END=1357 /DNA_ORIENTATION=-
MAPSATTCNRPGTAAAASTRPPSYAVMATSPRPAKKKHPLMHLLAGGAAGLVEASVCHPLDTVKTRIQLQGRHSYVSQLPAHDSAVRAVHSTTSTNVSSTAVVQDAVAMNIRRLFSSIAPTQQPGTVAATAPLQHQVLGPIGTARHIIRSEGFAALYKGLTAVYTGIVPKMSIRFLSFEWYRERLSFYSNTYMHRQNSQQQQPLPPGQYTRSVTFLAGLSSGLTEAVLVVTPAEVCKIRMQSDKSPLHNRKYVNVVQTSSVIVREEGLGALYSGVVPTMMRQGCNQAVNFTTYNYFKDTLIQYRKDRGDSSVTGLRPHESLVLGGVSGGLGPVANNPLDVVKTRMQKQIVRNGCKPKYTGLLQSCVLIAKEEGSVALWKGITPRLLRIVPGQAITFTTYEFVSRQLSRHESR